MLNTQEQRPATSLVLDPDTPRKKKLKKELFKEVKKSQAKTKKIRKLTQSLKRYKKKVVSLKHILQTLQNKCILDGEKALLLQNMTNVNREMLTRKLSKKGKYSVVFLNKI